MALVTSVEVQQIYPTSEDLAFFIGAADILVTEELANQGLSVNRLKQIELYLAAHFAVITLERGGLTRQRMGDSEDFYQLWTNNKIGLQATRFGQQAIVLDTSGTLAQLGTAKLQARFSFVGKRSH